MHTVEQQERGGLKLEYISSAYQRAQHALTPAALTRSAARRIRSCVTVG